MHSAWILLLAASADALPLLNGGFGLFKKKYAVAPIAIIPGDKGSLPPPPAPVLTPAPYPPPPMPAAMPMMPPPLERGPDFIHLQPIVDHQVVVYEQPPAAIMEEPVMLAPPPPPPMIHMAPPPHNTPYIPPTYVDMPAPQKGPVVIHAQPVNAPAVPNFLPTKEARISSPGYYPVAVLATPGKGQFTRVGRVPSKEGPALPSMPVQIRPAMKGEI